MCALDLFDSFVRPSSSSLLLSLFLPITEKSVCVCALACSVLSCVCVSALVDDVGRQHLGQLVVLETSTEELLFREVAVAVLVHPGEDVLGALLKRESLKMNRLRWPTKRKAII